MVRGPNQVGNAATLSGVLVARSLSETCRGNRLRTLQTAEVSGAVVPAVPARGLCMLGPWLMGRRPPVKVWGKRGVAGGLAHASRRVSPTTTQSRAGQAHGHPSDADARHHRSGSCGPAEVSEPYPGACRTLDAAQRKAELYASVEAAWKRGVRLRESRPHTNSILSTRYAVWRRQGRWQGHEPGCWKRCACAPDLRL